MSTNVQDLKILTNQKNTHDLTNLKDFPKVKKGKQKQKKIKKKKERKNEHGNRKLKGKIKTENIKEKTKR